MKHYPNLAPSHELNTLDWGWAHAAPEPAFFCTCGHDMRDHDDPDPEEPCMVPGCTCTDATVADDYSTSPGGPGCPTASGA